MPAIPGNDRQPARQAATGAERCRRVCLALLLASVALWAASLAWSVTFYGERVTFRFDDGSTAFYFGGDEALRNTLVINNFVWPCFSTGAGTEWSQERWGRWECYGPATNLTAGSLAYRCRHPHRLGFHPPGASLRASPLRYVGIPFWAPALVGAGGLAVAVWRRPRGADLCHACGYSRAGLERDAACPECGDGPNSPSRLHTA